MTLEERLLAKLDRSGGQMACWPWIGSRVGTGYGHIQVIDDAGIKHWPMAHRVVYQTFVGPIADGLQIDHLCGNRSCCNPVHLEPVTPRINNLRSDSLSSRRARVTHCPAGHEYTGANTHISKIGQRRCMACNRIQLAVRSRTRRARLIAAGARPLSCPFCAELFPTRKSRAGHLRVHPNGRRRMTAPSLQDAVTQAEAGR